MRVEQEQPLIEVRNLTKSYGDFSLRDVSFCVPQGSIMGFVGENGAGKTTTIKLMLNLVAKESGGITLFGLDHQEQDLAIKERIGVVLDGCNFYEGLRAKQIDSVMKSVYQTWDSPLFYQYISDFKIPAAKKVKEYSKGMKMKMAIALALAHHPKILILDEATSGLDPVVRNEILDIFLDFIQDEEHAIFFSTHITSDIEKIADYVTFLHEGQVVFSESKDEILDTYGLLKCGLEDYKGLDKADIFGSRESQFGYEVLVKNRREMAAKYEGSVIDKASIEDIIYFIVKGQKKK